MIMNIKSYAQRNLLWSWIKINNTSSTIGRYGCTLTCIGDMTGRSPKSSHSWLKSLGAFSRDLILWSRVPKFVHRFYCTDKPAPIAEIKAYLKARKPVLLLVSFEKNVNKPNHWVLATGYSGDTIYINDPWYGDKSTVAPRYGKTSAIAILGGAYFNYVIPAPVTDPCAAVKAELATAKARIKQLGG